ncbi:hypothetical protein JB92DRAFT_2921847 [Gautieria morchelliformis]|nr:hypothetical protein JB92DRAFT_2921847 [Gautieria morchelliformis]
MASYKINCYITAFKLFLGAIELKGNDRTFVLRKAIFNEVAAELVGVTAAELTLYKVKRPIPLSQEAVVDAAVDRLFPGGQPSETGLEELDPWAKLSEVFCMPPEQDALHILVVVPPQITVVPQVTVQDVHRFMISAVLPRYSVAPSTSTSTPAYASVGQVMRKIDVPCFLVQDPNLLSRMQEDLISRCLPKFNRLFNLKLFEHSRTDHRRLVRDAALFPLANEAEVWQVTDGCLRVCIGLVESLGCNSHYRPEVSEGKVNVTVDRLVKVNDEGVIAWEDKSPAVFEKHCTQSNLANILGSLKISKTRELGLLAIIFKLSIFMVSRGIKWGVIHVANTMYIIRVEKKFSRPYIVISSPLPMDATTLTPLSLICYMILSGREDVDVVDPKVVARISVPSGPSGDEQQEFDFPEHDDGDDEADDDFNLNLLKANSVTVDLPALGDRTPLIDASSDPVHLIATSFIGAGGFGRVFKAALFHPNGCSRGGLVIKLAQQGCERELKNEAKAYMRLGKLAGRLTPTFYGLFSGVFEDVSFSMIVLSYKGHSLTSFDGLAKFTRLSIALQLYRLHRAGVEVNDMKAEHVLHSRSGYYLIDFSVAGTNHLCPGISRCSELIETMDELHISKDSLLVKIAQAFSNMSPYAFWIFVAALVSVIASLLLLQRYGLPYLYPVAALLR